MYKKIKPSKTSIKYNEATEGETMIAKMNRILNNKEPIKDGAPLQYSEKKDGVLKGFDIRTDIWEVALDGIDSVQRSDQAKKDQIAGKKEGKVIDLNSGTEPTHGTQETNK